MKAAAAAAGITCSPPRQVVPGPGLPHDLRLLRANNNLDAVRHEGRLYLAFRNAPNHFAHAAVRTYVVASDDGGDTWSLEAKIKRGRDMREPRFLSWSGRLFLYFFEAGTNPFSFKPNRIFACERRGDGSWTEPIAISGKGYVAWRTKVVNGVPYMTAYRGGENIYSRSSEALEVELLTTQDGYHWMPVNPNRRAVYRGGGSECDFELADDGTLFAVIRNEAGDASGFGSLVCRAPADDITRWECVPDPRKFDSPLVFKHAGEIYLIGRRNLTGTGNYDLRWRRLGPIRERLLYELVYYFTRKRTSLWRLDRERLGIDWLLDLPSRGDTSFPALVPLDERRYLVFNYSSPLDGPDKFWLWGMLTPTHIYATVLTFEEPRDNIAPGHP